VGKGRGLEEHTRTFLKLSFQKAKFEAEQRERSCERQSNIEAYGAKRKKSAEKMSLLSVHKTWIFGIVPSAHRVILEALEFCIYVQMMEVDFCVKISLL
jgi:hypothetical protein